MSIAIKETTTGSRMCFAQAFGFDLSKMSSALRPRANSSFAGASCLRGAGWPSWVKQHQGQACLLLVGVCAKYVSRRGSGWLVARGVELCSPNRDDPIPNPSIRSGKEMGPTARKCRCRFCSACEVLRSSSRRTHIYSACVAV